MKRLFTAFVIIFSLFLTSTTYAKSDIIEKDKLDLITDKSIASVVKIFIVEDKNYGGCSGVVLKNTPTKSVVLTAKHCISFNGELYVENIPVINAKVSFKNDLAYLILNDYIPNKTSAKLSNYIPHNGDLILGVGYPGRNLYTVKGKIFIEMPTEQLSIMEIPGGASGGGVFNEKGNLIGIMIRYYPSNNIGVLVKLIDIHKFVNVNRLLEE